MRLTHHLQKVCFALLATAGLIACSEKVDTSARYVFKYDTAMSYLSRHEAYSTYVSLLGKVPVSVVSSSTVGQLLSARGNYTVFAPTNEAIQKYLEELCAEDSTILPTPSWDAFVDSTKLDSIRKVIVYNSIIDGADEEFYEIARFPQKDKEEFPLANMIDHKLSVHYITAYPDSIYINNDHPLSITERDIMCLNGVIHQVGKVIAPKDISATSYIQEALDKQKDGFLVAFRVIQACGLMDTLRAIRDEVYEDLYQRGLIEDLQCMTCWGFAEGSVGYAPQHRKYGFTLFLEPDDFWRSQGIDPKSPTLLQELCKWIQDNHQYSNEDVFVTDENYASEDHLLYQWITYHMLPMKIPIDRLVIHNNEFGYTTSNPYNYTIPVYEFYTTMGKRRLFKIIETKESNGIYINRFPNLRDGRKEDYHEDSCDPDKVGAHILTASELTNTTDMVNCNIYPLDAPISYNDDVRDNLAKQRIRFDGMSCMPEAMNNDIRKKKATDERYQHVYIPCTSIYNYFENFKQNDDTKFVYYNAYGYDWCNLNADEMKAVGHFEITITLPPVPRRGTYEFRYCVLANGNRGVQQIYFGTDLNNLPVAGIPLDLTKGLKSSSHRQFFGWEDDTGDEDFDAEVDHRLRNNDV
nr:fasciclin domain-containing protein [Bacteroidaceae bacterium]